MRNPSFLVLNLIAIVIIAFACGKSGTETPPANEEEYDELIAQGWQAFAEKTTATPLRSSRKPNQSMQVARRHTQV